MLVLAPKRASTIEDPECVVKVQVHEQIEEYKQTFDYYIQTTVTTLVGGSTSAQVNPTGTIPLSEAQFRANIDRCICVDQDKNVFFLVDNDGKFAAFMLNEEADKLISLKSDINALFNSPVWGITVRMILSINSGLIEIVMKFIILTLRRIMHQLQL